MLPDSLLLHKREGAVIRPRFVEPEELPVLEEMIVARERAVGRFQVELEERLVGDLRFPKRRLVARVLAGLARAESRFAFQPRAVRSELFVAGAGMTRSRESALALVAEKMGTSPAEIEASLFADLPGERRVAPLSTPVSPESLRWKVNAALVAGFLARSVRVSVETDGDSTPLARHARWSGLIAERTGDGMVLSGPFALFRHTGLYARALAGIVGALARLEGRFTVDVELKLSGVRGVMTLDETAPVFVDDAPPSAASPAARFAAAWKKLAPGWAAIVDPAPVVAGDERLDADVLLVPPEGGAGHHVELLRFWNAPHVRKRLAQWQGAGAHAWFLLDDDHNTAEEPAPGHASVLTYRKKPDAATLLARITTTT